jgi:hypothetical protein
MVRRMRRKRKKRCLTKVSTPVQDRSALTLLSEFLDDEPVHDDIQRRRPVFLEEEETEDDLRVLAAAYEVAGREYSRAA